MSGNQGRVVRAGRPGLDFRQEQRLFSSVSLPEQHLGLPILSLRVKWPEREADFISLSSAEVKNVWSFTSTHFPILIV